MNLENEYSYLSFIKSWDNERYVMTPKEVNELVRDLAQSYYLALSQYSELVKEIQMTVQKGVKPLREINSTD